MCQTQEGDAPKEELDPNKAVHDPGGVREDQQLDCPRRQPSPAAHEQAKDSRVAAVANICASEQENQAFWPAVPGGEQGLREEGYGPGD